MGYISIILLYLVQIIGTALVLFVLFRQFIMPLLKIEERDRFLEEQNQMLKNISSDLARLRSKASQPNNCTTKSAEGKVNPFPMKEPVKSNPVSFKQEPPAPSGPSPSLQNDELFE